MSKRKRDADRRSDSASNMTSVHALSASARSTSSFKSSTSAGTDIVKATNALSYEGFLSAHIRNERLSYQIRPDVTANEARKTFHISLKTSFDSEDHTQALSTEDLDTCFQLLRETSIDDYRSSGWGWHPVRKKKEMRERDMQYLIVRTHTPTAHEHVQDHDAGTEVNNAIAPTDDRSTEPLASSHETKDPDPHLSDPPFAGFLSFMITHEDGLPVLYVYEIHLAPHGRGCGLGAHLLDTVLEIGASVGVDKVMLTVFKRNRRACAWYEGKGFGIDEFSPRPKRLRGGTVKEVDYLILSRALAREDAWVEA